MKLVVPKAGKYVVAVSGGVDSVTLLDLLQATPGVQLIVAHFDHGMRKDSVEDRRFVQRLAKQHGLPFVYDEGHLGSGSSEARARTARYNFLRRARQASGARAILTAHHEDDVLETAILNLLRGTGRKGLSSLRSTSEIIRPLLAVPKREVIAYAGQHNLAWREDSTNTDQSYRRNHVRHVILSGILPEQRRQLLEIMQDMQRINHELDMVLINHLHAQPGIKVLDRGWFIRLSHTEAKEIMAMWLRLRGIRDFDRRTLERITVACKTHVPGKQIEVINGVRLQVKRHELALVLPER